MTIQQITHYLEFPEMVIYVFKLFCKDKLLEKLHLVGDVLYSSRQLVRTSCPMNLADYPFDTQQCSLEIESFAHTTADIKY